MIALKSNGQKLSMDKIRPNKQFSNTLLVKILKNIGHFLRYFFIIVYFLLPANPDRIQNILDFISILHPSMVQTVFDKAVNWQESPMPKRMMFLHKGNDL
jgi:hypothetical protein